LALDQLGEASEEVQPLFITVDPERDTPQLLADYVPLFHPRIVGLSGDVSAVGETCRVIRRAILTL